MGSERLLISTVNIILIFSNLVFCINCICLRFTEEVEKGDSDSAMMLKCYSKIIRAIIKMS